MLCLLASANGHMTYPRASCYRTMRSNGHSVHHAKMMSIEIADNTRGIAPSARCGSGLAGPWTGQEWRSVGGMRSGESSISMEPS